MPSHDSPWNFKLKNFSWSILLPEGRKVSLKDLVEEKRTWMMEGKSGWQVHGEMGTEGWVYRHWEAVIPWPGMEREEWGIRESSPNCTLVPGGTLSGEAGCDPELLKCGYSLSAQACCFLISREILQVSRLRTSTAHSYVITLAWNQIWIFHLKCNTTAVEKFSASPWHYCNLAAFCLVSCNSK